MGKPRFIKIVGDSANCSLLLTFGSRKEASDFVGLIDEEVNTQINVLVEQSQDKGVIA